MPFVSVRRVVQVRLDRRLCASQPAGDLRDRQVFLVAIVVCKRRGTPTLTNSIAHLVPPPRPPLVLSLLAQRTSYRACWTVARAKRGWRLPSCSPSCSTVIDAVRTSLPLPTWEVSGSRFSQRADRGDRAAPACGASWREEDARTHHRRRRCPRTLPLPGRYWNRPRESRAADESSHAKSRAGRSSRRLRSVAAAPLASKSADDDDVTTLLSPNQPGRQRGVRPSARVSRRDDDRDEDREPQCGVIEELGVGN